MLAVYRIKADNDSNIYNYYLKDGENQLGIIFCGNNDLYFCSFSRSKESEFFITKENMVIYGLFCKLLNSFQNVTVFNVSKFDLLQCNDNNEINKLYEDANERNLMLKESEIYKHLFNNGTVIWISDDSVSFDYQSADSMRIIKEEDCFKLKFTFYEDVYPHVRSIRIRNARSRYKPFNMLMMDFYNSLQNYDPDYHQIHIEEYLLDKEKSKKLIKK